MSTNCRIKDKIESKKNLKTGGIMRESKEARYLHKTNRIKKKIQKLDKICAKKNQQPELVEEPQMFAKMCMKE